MKNLKKILSIILFFVSTATFAQSDTLMVQTSAECTTCKKKLEKEMPYEKGVKAVELNLDNKVLMVVYNKEKTNPELIRNAIAKLGYSADSIPANKKAYDRLPSCCKVDGMKH